jgi:hypothetical protein
LPVAPHRRHDLVVDDSLYSELDRRALVGERHSHFQEVEDRCLLLVRHLVEPSSCEVGQLPQSRLLCGRGLHPMTLENVSRSGGKRRCRA